MSDNTTEIEYKFLAEIVGPLPTFEVVVSVQSYLVSRKSWEWRIRELIDEAGRSSYLTAIKTGNGFVRREFEYRIPRFLGKLLMYFALPPIVKTRVRSHGWDIDMFHEPPFLAGLCLAEIEVDTTDSPLPPNPSGLLLVKDVTSHGGFANKNLCRYGLPDDSPYQSLAPRPRRRRV